MKQRPLSVTAVSLVFIAAGAFGLAYHVTEFKAWHPFPYDLLWISLLRLMAIVCGVYILRGSNWARWLAVAWMAFHVIISAFQSVTALAVHSVLLVVIAFVLFRQAGTKYFTRKELETGRV